MLPFPPSMNRLYRARRGGGKALSDEALAFREKVKVIMGRKMAGVTGFPTDLETVYELDLILYHSNLENAGWYQRDKSGERKAKTRYKRFDADNRLKFLQDALIKGIGIPDDSQVFEVRVTKMWSAEPEPSVGVRITVKDPSDYRLEVP